MLAKMDVSLKRLSICLLLSAAAVISQDAPEPPVTETPTVAACNNLDDPRPCEVFPPNSECEQPERSCSCPVSPQCELPQRDCSCAVLPSNSQCELPERNCSFMKKALSGGCIHKHCENTIASAECGLDNGADILEMDVCISKDNVLFLWYDCDFYQPLAIARRLGQFLNGTCAPYIHQSAYSAKTTRDLTWVEIQEKLGYVDKSAWCGRDQSKITRVPSLEQFLRHFANDKRVRHFHVDMKVAAADAAAATRRAYRLADCLGVSSKTIFGFNNVEAMAAGQCALRQVGGNPQEVALDFDLTLDDFGAVNGAVLQGLKNAEQIMRNALVMKPVCDATTKMRVLGMYKNIVQQGLNSILPAIKMASAENPLRRLSAAVEISRRACVRYINIGIPPITQGFAVIERVLDGLLASRDASHKNLHISVFGFSKDVEAALLIAKGVDGLSHGKVRRFIHPLNILKAGGCGWKCRAPPVLPKESK